MALSETESMERAGREEYGGIGKTAAQQLDRRQNARRFPYRSGMEPYSRFSLDLQAGGILSEPAFGEEPILLRFPEQDGRRRIADSVQKKIVYVSQHR